MILRQPRIALAVTLLLALPFSSAISQREIPEDTPISSLLASAKRDLAAGNANDALTYFDIAVTRDPTNYLTIFQRGATYLSLGRVSKASDDFDKVLSIKPDFQGALLQRAKLKSRNADWEAAKRDYGKAGKADSQEFQSLLEAEGAARLAVSAEKSGDYEGCIGHSGTAIIVASTALELRQLRARCRFERGEVLEGVSDLQHVLQISPGSIEPHLQISAMLFYSIGDMEKGVSQVNKCLQSDPDSKACRKLRKQEKELEKIYKKILQMEERRQYVNAVNLLVGKGEDTGMIGTVKREVKEARAAGTIHKHAPDDLYGSLVEKACDFYAQMNNKKRAEPYCKESLQLNPNSLPALLHQAQRQLDSDEFEPAIHTLNHAKEHHPSANQIQELLQKAHNLLRRSKTKDYYKVLGVSRDADERTIKQAYRGLVRIHHPDKAAVQGVSKEEAEKKMAVINEAYEVLSDSEKKAQFDQGVDPNDPHAQGNPFQGSPFGHGPGGQPVFFKNDDGFGGGGAFRFQQSGGFQFPGGFQFGGM